MITTDGTPTIAWAPTPVKPARVNADLLALVPRWATAVSVVEVPSRHGSLWAVVVCDEPDDGLQPTRLTLNAYGTETLAVEVALGLVEQSHLEPAIVR